MSGQSFDEWCLVELLGHHRLAGRCSEQDVAGAGLLRVDIYPGDAQHPVETQLVNPKMALYRLRPITEAMARGFAARFYDEPLARWELQAAPEPVPREAEPDLDGGLPSGPEDSFLGSTGEPF